MNKNVLVIIADGFEEIEAITVIDILRRCGVSVVVAGLDKIEIKGSHNIIINADKILDKNDNCFEAIVLPGGMPGSKNLSDSPLVDQMLFYANSEKKIIAAICAAPAVVLASKGILSKKKATCFPSMEEKFDDSTIFSENRVVVDGNIITSRGAGTSAEFVFVIAEELGLKEKADEMRVRMLF